MAKKSSRASRVMVAVLLQLVTAAAVVSAAAPMSTIQSDDNGVVTVTGGSDIVWVADGKTVRMSTLLQRLDDMQGDIDVLKQKAGLLDTQVADVDSNVQKVDKRVTALNESLDVATDNLKQRLDELDSDVGTTDQRVSNVDGRVDDVNGRVDTLDGKLTTVSGEASTATSSINTLNSAVSGLDNRVTTIENTPVKIDELNSVLECSEKRQFYATSSDKCISSTPEARSCAELLKIQPGTPSGLHELINEAGVKFTAYCDMKTDSGGWTLVAKVTDDFGWICPDQNGGVCTNSGAPRDHANLFHPIHTRDTVDLSFEGTLADTGVHLPLSTVKRLFEIGETHEIRFLFADDNWTPKNDGVFKFRTNAAAMFMNDEHGEYLRGRDYDLNVLTNTQGTFDANAICWGLNSNINYRGYDQGLHMGKANPDPGVCHMANDNNAVQMKSHYTNGGDGSDSWYSGQHGFLAHNALQVPSKRIAIFVRSKPHTKKPGSIDYPATSCQELVEQGIQQSGTYWLTVNERKFVAHCDMQTAGGGWTLVARITHDYEWACPEMRGEACYPSSTTSAEYANLFELVHTRASVGLTGNAGLDTGVHLPVKDIRQLFTNKREIRFLFATGNAWDANNDVSVQFKSVPSALFDAPAQGSWLKGTDYTVSVITNKQGNVQGDILCWGVDHSNNYRGYEGGLHFGSDEGAGCHLQNAPNDVQLKSHLANADQSAWYQGNHGFLRNNIIQIGSDRIAIWVR